MSKRKLMIAIMCICILVLGTWALASETIYSKANKNYMHIYRGKETLLIPQLTFIIYFADSENPLAKTYFIDTRSGQQYVISELNPDVDVLLAPVFNAS